MPRYDAASRCTTGPTKGAISVRDHWEEVTGLGNLGIFNCRTVRGGKTTSVHGEGRAVDLKANAHNDHERQTADFYADFLIRVRDEIGMQYLIWNARQSGGSKDLGWRPYSGVSSHRDHIHTELNRAASQSVTIEQLRRLWNPSAAQTPEQRLEAWMVGVRARAGELLPYVQAMPNLNGSTPYSWHTIILQQTLNLLESAGLVEDGLYGPSTIKAVWAWQQEFNRKHPGFITDFPGAAHETTRWWLSTTMSNLHEGRA